MRNPMSSGRRPATSTCPAAISASGKQRSAIRQDPEYAALMEAVSAPRVFAVEVLYTDHEGGQHTIGMFSLAPMGESRWLCSMVRHWNLDRPDPR